MASLAPNWAIGWFMVPVEILSPAYLPSFTSTMLKHLTGHEKQLPAGFVTYFSATSSVTFSSQPGSLPTREFLPGRVPCSYQRRAVAIGPDFRYVVQGIGMHPFILSVASFAACLKSAG